MDVIKDETFKDLFNSSFIMINVLQVDISIKNMEMNMKEVDNVLSKTYQKFVQYLNARFKAEVVLVIDDYTLQNNQYFQDEIKASKSDIFYNSTQMSIGLGSYEFNYMDNYA